MFVGSRLPERKWRFVVVVVGLKKTVACMRRASSQGLARNRTVAREDAGSNLKGTLQKPPRRREWVVGGERAAGHGLRVNVSGQVSRVAPFLGGQSRLAVIRRGM